MDKNIKNNVHTFEICSVVRIMFSKVVLNYILTVQYVYQLKFKFAQIYYVLGINLNSYIRFVETALSSVKLYYQLSLYIPIINRFYWVSLVIFTQGISFKL